MKKLIEFDQTELACVIAEGCLETKRPPGRSAEDALNAFDEDVRLGFYRAAENAIKYMQGQLANAMKAQ